MDWLSIAGAILFYTVYPVLLLGRLLLYILDWILTPFVYVGYVSKEVALIPCRFLAEFEVRPPLPFNTRYANGHYLRPFGIS
jgi:hypothetical protein